MSQFYREAAQRWQESAEFWRVTAQVAYDTGDFRRSCFAHLRALMSEVYAEQDLKKAGRP